MIGDILYYMAKATEILREYIFSNAMEMEMEMEVEYAPCGWLMQRYINYASAGEVSSVKTPSSFRFISIFGFWGTMEEQAQHQNTRSNLYRWILEILIKGTRPEAVNTMPWQGALGYEGCDTAESRGAGSHGSSKMQLGELSTVMKVDDLRRGSRWESQIISPEQ